MLKTRPAAGSWRKPLRPASGSTGDAAMDPLLPPDPALAGGLAFLDLGQCRIAYRQVGQGEPLLLVHGYPLHGMTFRHLIPILARHFTCIVPDLPGLGATEWTGQTDFSFAGQARTLKEFVDRLGLTAYAILAHDTGGTIARRLTTTDLARVRKLVLIGTEIPGHRPPWIELFQKAANPRRTATFKILMRRRWFRHSSAAFGGCFHDRSLIDGAFHQLFIEPLLRSDERIRGQIHYLRGIDWQMVGGMRAEHAKITIPTLLIWGAQDPVFPVAAARAMAKQLPNCRGLAIIPEAKLFVHEERPEDVAKAALDVLLAA
jgi:pimeloyl-ACP methyl ester carboxylesterase